MGKETIHLIDGSTIQAEVNGKTMDGRRGYVFIWAALSTLRRTLQESAEVEVVRRDDGTWEEVKVKEGKR